MSTIRIGSCCLDSEILSFILNAYKDNLNENGNYRRITIQSSRLGDDNLNNDATREVLCQFLSQISREKTVLLECDDEVFDSWSRDTENPDKITLKYKGEGGNTELRTFVPDKYRGVSGEIDTAFEDGP